VSSENRAIVVGLPGVGKTTVLNELQRIAKQENFPLKIVNYGTVMLRFAEESVKERDYIRKTSKNFQFDIQRRAAEEIVEKNPTSDGVLLIDTHMIVKTHFGYLPGIPSYVLSIFKPRLIVMIEAPSKEIISRRVKDVSGRRRDEVLTEDIELEIQVSRMMASACSVLAGTPLGVIENIPGAANKAAEQLFQMVKAGGG